jgi:hypothetical protein
MMKKLLFKLALFASPFLILFSTVVVVDPFAYFDWFDFTSARKKAPIAGPYNQALWRVIDFHRHPASKILIGDSRAGLFDQGMIRRLSGEDVYVFTIPGGSLIEMVHAFWFAERTVRLEKVYFAVDLCHYNKYWDHDRISGALQTLDNPLLYLSHRDVLAATRALIKERFAGGQRPLGKPAMSKETFWNYQLNTTAGTFYRYYAYPERLRHELEKISEHCAKHQIQLVFIILPNHISAQEKMEQFGLGAARQRFRSDLKSFGTLIDFNYSSEMTRDRDNFSDPFHFKPKRLQRSLIRQIWSH